MSDSREVFRSLSMLTQVGLQLLIPILIGVFGGLGLDRLFDCSPTFVIILTVVGIVAAFRNLYVWSVREIRRAGKSERVLQAIREAGQQEEPKEEDSDRQQ